MKSKKILCSIALVLGVCSFAHADTTPPIPVPTLPPFSATALGGQVLLSLTADAVTVYEFTTAGKTKVEALDGLIGIGHYKGDYVAAIDAGPLDNSINPGRSAVTVGIHAHVISTLNDFLALSPDAAATLSYLQLTPRVSWDTDVHAVVWGATFGLQIPFK